MRDLIDPDDGAKQEPWICPWGICNQAQAQACRSTIRRDRFGSHAGCGGRFPADMTPEQAKEQVGPPRASGASAAGAAGVMAVAASDPAAWVPIHPRSGPLWSMTTDKPNPERLPNSYPLRPLVFAPGVALPRAPLTDVQIFDLLPNLQSGWTLTAYGLWVARAIERAHGIDGVTQTDGGQKK